MEHDDDVEGRLRRLEDMRELETLLARYSFNADLSRHEEWVGLFTEDGAIDLKDMNLDRYQGPKELLAFIKGDEASALANVAFHIAYPTVFYVDGDNATGEGYALNVTRDMSNGPDDRSEGARPIYPLHVDITSGNYSHWIFRRVEGEWRIALRDVKLLASPNAADALKRTVR